MPHPLNITINSNVELKVFQIKQFYNEQVCEYQFVVIRFSIWDMLIFELKIDKFRSSSSNRKFTEWIEFNVSHENI